MGLGSWRSSVASYLESNKYPAKAHARAVAAYLSIDSGIVYLESQKHKLLEDSDSEAPFRQRRPFFYLTGCLLPDSYVTYDIGAQKLTLYIPPIDPKEVMWSGLPLTKEEAMKKYDIDEAKYTTDLDDDLKRFGAVLAIPELVERNTVNVAENSKLREAIDECRVFKDDYEIALIRHANEISTEAHKAVMRAASKVDNERELQAIFLSTCISLGSKEQAYGSIVAAGRNAATLHYTPNDQPTKGCLNILLDAGCEASTYASDITRVFPINGKFTTESRQIYEIVLKMQKMALNIMKPGTLWDDVHKLVHEIMIDGLLELGILRNGTRDEILKNRTSAAFLPHGLGHFLGMDTHDTGGQPNYSDSDPMFRYLRCRRVLQPGMVVTVEPGLYFCEFIIRPYLADPKHNKYIDEKVLDKYWDVGGVRIEDDVVITDGLPNNLTDTPKEVEEIEALVNGQ